MTLAKKQPISTDLEDVVAGWQGRLADAFGEVARRRFAPPSRQTVDQWAREYRYLPETAAEPGRWNPSRAPYQVGIMQAFTSPAVCTITIQSGEPGGKIHRPEQYTGLHHRLGDGRYSLADAYDTKCYGFHEGGGAADVNG